MKKLIIVSLISLSMFMPQLYSISVAEYVQQNGMPQILDNGKLELTGKGLTSLEGLQDIVGINKVRVLDLSHNHLQELPTGIFNGLHNLKRLDLGYNSLQTLPDGILSGLDNLQWLELTCNQLRTLPSTIFNGLHNLQIIELDYNQLQTLPMGIFDGLHRLKMLDIISNQLQKLPDGLFNSLSNLEELSLYENQLQMLPNNIFSNLSNLKILDLSVNRLQTLQASIFSNLSNLEELFLNNNPFNADFLLSLLNITHIIPTLKSFDGFEPDKALQYYRVYNPKTLKESTLKYLMKYLTFEQLEELTETGHPAFDLLPLTPQQKADIIAKNMDAYRYRLHKLPYGDS